MVTSSEGTFGGERSMVHCIATLVHVLPKETKALAGNENHSSVMCCFRAGLH